MSGLVLIGTQWGDEGKGKVTNYLASRADMVVRFQGGANAGHTVGVGGRTVVFHLLPSGISEPGATCVIGPGVVLDPEELVAEIDRVAAQGIRVGPNLLVDVGAHLVLPYHKAVEAAEEEARGADAIGTTHRGIGPAYSDRCTREGIRAGDLAAFERFRERFVKNASRRNELLSRLYGKPPVDIEGALAGLERAAARIAPHLSDTPPIVRGALRSGKNVLFEGAQGSLLDVSFGTYPYVTSSHTTAAGVPAGTGVPPSMIGEVVGVAKAYTTRVGAGSVSTEAGEEAAGLIRERGAERGATTGRPRRCGWFDAVAVRSSESTLGHRTAHPDQARRARRLRQDPRLRRLRARRQADRPLPPLARRPRPRPPGLRGSAGVAAEHPRRQEAHRPPARGSRLREADRGPHRGPGRGGLRGRRVARHRGVLEDALGAAAVLARRAPPQRRLLDGPAGRV